MSERVENERVSESEGESESVPILHSTFALPNDLLVLTKPFIQ